MVENNQALKYYAYGLISHGVKCYFDDTTRNAFSYTVFAELNMDIVDWIRNITHI